MKFPWILLLLVLVVAYPLVPGFTDETGTRPMLNDSLDKLVHANVGSVLPTLFIFAILGLALNVVLGYTGQLHLGIAAFFGIGAFAAGILRVTQNPFQLGFWQTIALATLFSTMVGVLVSAPTLRLRGDYLALVTLGFGMIAITLLRKFEEITGGKKTLTPIPEPSLPAWLKIAMGDLGITPDWVLDYRPFYYLNLGFLVAVYWLLRNLERSRLGRSWFAVREDELAATCMGINAARVKLGSFALGAGLAGLAGALYAIRRNSTLEPTFYDFQLSVTILCAIILGGLGNRNGVLLGIFFISGFEYLFSSMADGYLQRSGVNPNGENRFLLFSTWKMMIFGLALILVMRFRPHGLLPAVRGEAKPV